MKSLENLQMPSTPNCKRNHDITCNFDSFYNVALVLHENVLVFSRSEARIFLKYIIIVSTAICSFSMKDGNQSSDIQKTRFSITYKTY